MSDIGKKNDAGKPRWRLLPWHAVQKVVDVLGFGAKKYGDDNWRKVDNAQDRYFDAALRHLVAWRNGEDLDPESGLPRLAHASCCILFLIDITAWAQVSPVKNSVYNILNEDYARTHKICYRRGCNKGYNHEGDHVFP